VTHNLETASRSDGWTCYCSDYNVIGFTFVTEKVLDISVKGSDLNCIFGLMLSVIVWSLWEGLGSTATFSPLLTV